MTDPTRDHHHQLLAAAAHALGMRPGDRLDDVPAVAAERHIAAKNLDQQLSRALAELDLLRGQLSDALAEARDASAALVRKERDLAAEVRRLRADRDQAVRERDSLARRLGVRWEELTEARSDRDQLAYQVARLRKLYTDHAAAPFVSGDWLMGQLRELTQDAPAPPSSGSRPARAQEPTAALCILGPTREPTTITGDITEPRVLAALEVLGWPDDRAMSAHVEPDGFHITPAGHYYGLVEDVIRAADEAGQQDVRYDGTLTRWCAQPGCTRTYSADVGPQQRGWIRLRGLTVLCPDHAAHVAAPARDAAQPPTTPPEGDGQDAAIPDAHTAAETAGYQTVVTRLHRDGRGQLVDGDVVVSAVSTRPTLRDAVNEILRAITPADHEDQCTHPVCAACGCWCHDEQTED